MRHNEGLTTPANIHRVPVSLFCVLSLCPAASLGLHPDNKHHDWKTNCRQSIKKYFKTNLYFDENIKYSRFKINYFEKKGGRIFFPGDWSQIKYVRWQCFHLSLSLHFSVVTLSRPLCGHGCAVAFTGIHWARSLDAHVPKFIKTHCIYV